MSDDEPVDEPSGDDLCRILANPERTETYLEDLVRVLQQREHCSD